MRHHRFAISCVTLITAILFYSGWASAQVSYSIVDSIYEQTFDSLPNTPQNASLGTSPAGWIDDTTAPASGNFSIPGWYLWHPLDPSGDEDGFNHHQRMRAGAGSTNTGAFWSYGASGSTDRALASLGSATVAGAGTTVYMGMRLVNDTGQTLTDFSVGYDGEQWRTSGSGTRETLSFAYSLAAGPATWNLAETEFTAVPVLNFTAPVGGGAGTVDGNNLGRIARQGTISGINWEPGAELWLRWSDPGGAAATQDGLGIDNLRFTTGELPPIVGLPEITSVMSGPASNPSTWSNNQAPAAGNLYRVLDGHTVTVDYTGTGGGNPFPGNELRVRSGGVVHFDTSGVQVPLLIVEAGGNITESVTGDFALGDIFAPNLGSLQTIADLAFTINADSEFFLDMAVQGPGNIDFNSGDASVLWLSAAGGHGGRIRFNGDGDQVRLTERQSFGTLEMNSTGANELFHSPAASVTTGTLIFNQPGTINHAATADRLHGLNTLEANAAVTVDLSKGFPANDNQTDERRYQVATGMRGAGDVTVNGTAVDYSTTSGVSLNEFEVGSTGDPGNVSVSTFSGTLTGNNFVNIEIRQHFRDARFVVGNNARLEVGHQAIDSAHNIELGEVVVNNGGIFEVGFEQTSSTGVAGHHAYQTTLTDSSSRDGTLTINSGGTLRMQINGMAANEFDAITASGDVQLGGTLNVLVNPGASSGGGGTAANPIWTPAVGQTFDIITLAAGPGPAGDYDDSGTVDNADYDFWRMHFDSNNADADGNGNGVVDAADYVIWRKNFGATGGTEAEISGTFSNVSVTDFNGAMTGLGFKVNYLTTAVQLEVIAAPGAGSAVPEPSALVLAGMLLPLATKRRARRS